MTRANVENVFKTEHSRAHFVFTSEHSPDQGKREREVSTVATERVHKTLRLPAELADRASLARLDGETDTQLYARLIEAGLDAPAEQPTTTASQATVEALKGHIADLQKQLAVKDGQIEALQGITERAQALHGAAEMARAKRLESAEDKGKSRLARAWAAFKGGIDE